MIHIQLCIVTGQPIANLIPILQLKPDVIALIISEEMSRNGRAGSFKKSLLECGCEEARILEFHGVPDSRYTEIELRALEIQDDLQQRYPGSKIDYNLTGGNKLMALSFFNVFVREKGNTTFYVDTAHNVIEYISPEKSEPRQFEQLIDIPTYLKAYGKTVRQAISEDVGWRERVANRQSITVWIANNVEVLEDAIGCLNRASRSAYGEDGKKIEVPLQHLRFPPKGKYFKELLLKCKNAGLFDWDEQKPESVYFDNAEGAGFIGGGWLEEYMWLTASALDLYDIKANVQITDDINRKSDIRNELDLVITHNNKMLIVEAKTLVFGRDKEKDSAILNQLDSLGKNAGGIFCKRLLLSAKSLDHNTTKNRKVFVEDRARSQDIDTLSRRGILELKRYIAEWAGITL